MWAAAADPAFRQSFYEMGIYTPRERMVPDDPIEAVVAIFYGRPTLSVDKFGERFVVRS